jgi:hypothetical protein
VSASPQWCYVQARLQARHGERLQEPDWRAIETARSFESFVERAGASPMRRFSAGVHTRMSSHVVERVLREAWRAYVTEVASWVTCSWREAVRWTSFLPELPLIDALLDGEAPEWMKQDPAFAEFVDADNRQLHNALAASALKPLLPTVADDETIAMRWFAHWRTLWPHRRKTLFHTLFKLAATINAHFATLDRASPQQTSAFHRRDLETKLTHLFRRNSGTPAAVFCHLAVVALDLERLRGGLVRRRLFEPGNTTEAT